MSRMRPKKQDTCLLPGCERKLSSKWHFCKEHWNLVPEVLKRALTKTYELFCDKVPFNTVANDHRRKQWQLARGVAIVSVQEALGQVTVTEAVKRIDESKELARRLAEYSSGQE